MLDEGADPNSTSEECSSTPALLAAYSGHDKVLQVLIDHKQVSSKCLSWDLEAWAKIHQA